MHKKIYILLFFLAFGGHIIARPLQKQQIEQLKNNAAKYIKNKNQVGIAKVIRLLRNGGAPQAAEEIEKLAGMATTKPSPPAQAPPIKQPSAEAPQTTIPAAAKASQSNINECLNKINTLTKQIAQQDTELQAMRQQVVEKSKSLQGVTGQLKAHEDEFEKITKKTLEQDETIQAVSKELQEKKKEIEHLKKQLTQPTPPPVPSRDHPPVSEPKKIERPLPPTPKQKKSIEPEKETKEESDLAKQIQKVKLKKAKEREPEVPIKGSESLADILSEAIDKRRRDIKEDVDDEDSDGEEWE